MTRFQLMPFRDRYNPASGTMVLPLGFGCQVRARVIDQVADQVSAPLCRGWFRYIIGELALHAVGTDELHITYARHLLRDER